MPWRPLLLLLVAACGAPTRSTASPPRSEKSPPALAAAPDAAIDGTVTDEDTGRGIAGATIIANQGASDATAISDETGHFHIAVAAGRYNVTMFYADARREGGEVDVAAHASAPVAFTVSHRVVDRPARASEENSCPAVANAPAPTGGDVDALVAAALARYVADPSSIADGELAMHDGIAVVASDAGHVRLTSHALPAGRALELRSRKDIQVDADHRGAEITYLGISNVHILGDCATIEVSIDIASHEHPPHARLCCCSTTAIYEKQAGRWVFKATLHEMCA
jgi:hypothetical protein